MNLSQSQYIGLTHSSSPFDSQWVDCHHCKKQTLAKESTIILIDYDHFGSKGKTFVNLCKECHRDHQLNKLIE